MWVPRTEAEIVAAAGRPLGIVETMSCDAKLKLPGHNRDLAEDVAAMANEGGVLIYGVGEDSNKRAKELKPIKLSGARERVDQIVQAGIAEPPYIEPHPIETAADPSVGYLVVVVPASPRAPHMVTLGGDNRYYRRTATGNMPMNHLEVEMLFRRRADLEGDAEAVRTRELVRDPEPDNSLPKLYLLARPLLVRRLLAGSAARNSPDRERLAAALRAGCAVGVPSQVNEGSQGSAFAALSSLADHVWARTTRGWLVRFSANYGAADWADARGTNEIQVADDGMLRLYCGRVANPMPHRTAHGQPTGQSVPVLLEDRIAEYVARFLAIAGTLYESSEHHGQVDVAVRVSGVQGAITSRGWPAPRPLDEPEYRADGRYLAQELLQEWMRISHELIGPLLDALSQGRYAPFNPS